MISHYDMYTKLCTCLEAPLPYNKSDIARCGRAMLERLDFNIMDEIIQSMGFFSFGLSTIEVRSFIKVGIFHSVQAIYFPSQISSLLHGCH